VVGEIVNLVREDWMVVETVMIVEVSGFKERLGCLKFGEAVELESNAALLCEALSLIMFIRESVSVNLVGFVRSPCC
jgi:hypothetical protein